MLSDDEKKYIRKLVIDSLMHEGGVSHIDWIFTVGEMLDISSVKVIDYINGNKERYNYCQRCIDTYNKISEKWG